MDNTTILIPNNKGGRMLIFMTIMYFWAAATTILLITAGNGASNLNTKPFEYILGIFWPFVILMVLFIIISEVLDALWRKFR